MHVDDLGNGLPMNCIVVAQAVKLDVLPEVVDVLESLEEGIFAPTDSMVLQMHLYPKDGSAFLVDFTFEAWK